MRERFGTDSMPETADNVADEFGIARADQDAFALRSQERAAKAIASGRLAREIAPVTDPAAAGRAGGRRHRRAPAGDLAGGAGQAASRSTRAAPSPPATASGVNDGAAAVLIASEEAVRARTA